MQNNVDHLVKEYPYIIYSVRNINGSTRYAFVDYSNEFPYYIKIYDVFDKN